MKALMFGAGVDSLCCAVLIKPDALVWVDYGQKARRAELEASKVLSVYLGVPLVTERARVNLAKIGDYILNRNLLLTVVGVNVAVRAGYDEIVFAFTKPSPFPDTTLTWVRRASTLIDMEVPIKVSAPFANITKPRLIKMALDADPHLPLHLTVSCLNARPCRYPNLCPKCSETAKSLRSAGIDLTLWQVWL